MENICEWAKKSDKLLEYHNKEWCKIIKEDDKIFEMLVLEFMQAGLSWSIILNKREEMRNAFDNFDYKIIKNYNEEKVENLLKNEKIIKNKFKIKALINNANQFCNIQKEYTSFYNYIWSFTNFKQIENHYDIKSESDLSIKISKDMKKRGFNFLGPKIVYSFLEAIGVYNNHIFNCRYL